MKPLTSRDRVSNIVAAIAGDPKTAKTYTAFTSPAPIYYHEFDQGGLNRVKPYLPADLEINFEVYPLTDHDTKAKALKMYDHFIKEYDESVLAASLTGGTVIVDTDTLMWALMQIALTDETKKGPLGYKDANAKYRRIIGKAREHGANLILINQMKEVWERNEETGQIQATGRYIPHAHKEANALIDISLRTLKPYKGAGKTDFGLRVEFCGLDPTLEGAVFDSSGKTPNSYPLPASMASVRELLGVG